MATLYWGGGTGTWDGFTTTNWYTNLARTTLSTRAPSAEDDVIFDSASNATAYTVTIANNTTVCRSCTVSGPATGNVTIAGSGNWYIYGNYQLSSLGITMSYTGTISFYGVGTHTITTTGLTAFIPFTFAGIGTYNIQGAFNCASITINAGTVNTNNYTVTCSGNISGSGGTLNLGSSTVSALSINTTATVINGGTSTITLSSTSANIGGGTSYTGNTFYNVTFSSNSLATCNVYGNNTFNNLTFTTAALFESKIVLYGNQIVNGTLTIPGQLGSRRYFICSDTVGTTRTLTVAAKGALTDLDFRDITVAGASAPWSGTRLGDCKGNTNITFAAGTNKYIAAGTTSPTNWFQNIWATSSGGSAAQANFPLAQDTVIIDNAGLVSGGTLNIDNSFNIGTIDASSRTNAITIAFFANNNIYGNIILSTNVTTTNNSLYTWMYAGRVTQNITTNGKTIYAFNVNSPSGTVKLLDDLTTNNTITLTNGTFDANNKNVTASDITALGAAVKTLMLGSGTITTTTGVGATATISNLTITANTATITASSSAIFGFNGNGTIFGGTITVSGAANSATIYGTTTVTSLTLTASTATAPSDKLILNGDLTVTGTLALGGGSSVIARAFVRSNTLGTQQTLSAATVTGLTDIDFRDIAATGTANWTTGTRLGDCGGNSGITFPAAKTVYWNLAGNSAWSATAWAATSGGAVAINNFPLAQDTAVIDNAGLVSTITMNAAWNVGTINAVNRTTAGTFAGTGTPTIYGNVTYGSGITASVSGTFTFSGRGTQTFTTAGKTINCSIVIAKPTGTFQHGGAYTSNASITVTLGNYATQNYTLTSVNFSSTNTNTRSITLGTSTITLTGSLNFTIPTGLTFSGGLSTINLSSTSAKSFNGGSQIFGTVSSTGGTANPITFTGNNTFGTLTNGARTYLIFEANSIQTASVFTYTGLSGSVVRWYTSIPGQQATIKTASNAIGVNSIDGGNNVGLAFTGTSPNYFYVKDIVYSSIAISGGNFLMFFN